MCWRALEQALDPKCYLGSGWKPSDWPGAAHRQAPQVLYRASCPFTGRQTSRMIVSLPKSRSLAAILLSDNHGVPAVPQDHQRGIKRLSSRAVLTKADGYFSTSREAMLRSGSIEP